MDNRFVKVGQWLGIASRRRSWFVLGVIFALLLLPVLAAAQSLHGVSFSPVVVQSGSSTTCTITLNAPAVGGVNIEITNTRSFVHIPANVIVADGQASISFSVPVDRVPSTRSATFTFTDGSHTRTASIQALQTTALAKLEISDHVLGGETAYGYIWLNRRAGHGGFTAQLSSSQPFIKVPPTVTVVENLDYASFPIQTTKQSSERAGTVYCSAGGVTLKASLKVTRPPLALAVLPRGAVGGASVTGTVEVEFGVAAPTVVHLSSDQPFVQVPASVTIPKGQSVVNFMASTSVLPGSALASITATMGPYVTSERLSVLVGVAPWANPWHDTQATAQGIGSGCTGQIIEWSQVIPFGSFASDVAVASDGGTFVQLEDDFNSAGGGLAALNADGSIRWQYDAGMTLGYGSPVLWGGLVLYEDRTHAGASNVGASLHAVNQATGELVWSFAPGNYFESPIVSKQGRVFVGNFVSESVDYASAGIWALDAPSGRVLWDTGTTLWSPKTGGFQNAIPSALSPDEGSLYCIVSGGYEGITDVLVALDTSTGSIKWTWEALNLMSRPSIGADGTIYCLDFPAAPTDYPSFVAIDPATGITEHRTAVQHHCSYGSNPPAIGTDGTIFVEGSAYIGGGVYSGFVAALHADGSEAWATNVASQLGKISIDGGGVLYYCDTAVHALDSQTGLQLWSFSMPAGYVLSGDVSIGSDNHIFVPAFYNVVGPNGVPGVVFSIR